MPYPVHNQSMVLLCASFVLLSMSPGCASTETTGVVQVDAANEASIDEETGHDALIDLPQTPPPPAPPIEAGFMTEGSITRVGYDAFGPEGPLAYRTTFTPRPGSDFGRTADDTVWLARREQFKPEGTREVMVTSSLECPGLVYVLEQVSAFDTGRFNISGISRQPLRLGPQSRDGYTYRFFGPGYGADDSFIRLSIEGSSGDIGALGRVADFQLKDCWRHQVGE